MNKFLENRLFSANRPSIRPWIVRQMEVFQDIIVIILCLGLFELMILQTWAVFTNLGTPLDFKQVTAKILFILILVELFRLLVAYLQEHTIAVGVAVEVTIVSILREIIVHGALDISWLQVLPLCGLLLILGGLLVVSAKITPTDYITRPQLTPVIYSGVMEQQQKGENPNSPFKYPSPPFI
jgi:uncharacterized membrane protein (DUF373 family)